ncbi:ribosomal L39 protein-domain-containing protein [Mucor lusitanicus]|uniref:Large ribosomal subunit protein eL39 n=1 Tax=Mucor circinelloides f. lusitanicus TaxID=29924 RepID=A0A8H4BMS5_MUCCL|nr:ribosomal L39 protein-domain-containing protein [Mucor lusitanicus]
MVRYIDPSAIIITTTACFVPWMRNSPSQKSFITKVKLGKAKKQNRPLPHWFRLKTDTKIRWNAKRRNWRHTKLNI